MAIAGYAIGASMGYVYVRAEYPLAIERLDVAIKQARDMGLLGQNIFESGFSFELEIRMGAGAFVCGEETALMASIEGKRGMPRPKPPFPAQKGLWGQPSIINNVETLGNIRHIFLQGWEWFASIGTEKSKGTKVFALSGNVRNTGLVEVPMGITLGELVYEIGGGIPGDKAFKAVQTGGPSGGCIPAKYLNASIDYESLKELGSIMGSGGLIVLDEDTCMVSMAKYFLEFSLEESCGQCSPCRLGLKQMYMILDRITKGQGTLEDLDKLENLAKTVGATSLCGLGQAAPNPVLSTLHYFRHEYLDHINNKRCSAGVCAALFDAPCQNACPSNVDAASYISHMGDGRLEEAYRKHMENNPFPIACARVCPAFCESKCSRGKYDQAIAIREVKRLFADWAIENGMGFAPPLNPKKQRVAIIGAGPAGLSCGFYLTRLGYKPVVFEASNCAGGMMKWGIPDYRLPKDKLAAEIRVIERAGVDIQLNHTVKSLDELKTQGYEAVFIAAGAHVATRLDVPGADKAGVLSGIDFLYRVNGGERLPVGKKVVVIGGGSTAMDTARTAKRLGAEEVRVIYRRTRSEMPALQEELIEAEEEGILLDYLVAPLEVLGNGKVSGIRCQRTALGDFDNSGRRRPKPVEGSEFVLDADLVIPCLGQKMSDKLSHGAVTINKWGFVDADEKSMATNVAGVFAGGDNVNPSTVIECVAQGRRAAQAIDRHFGGEGALDKPHEVVRVAYDEDAYLVNLPRRKPGHNDIAERIRSLSLEVNRGLSLENGIEEARRCLHCDRKQEQEAAVLPKRRLELDEML
jgi:NADH-quinone oxidoreductase subunit F